MRVLQKIITVLIVTAQFTGRQHCSAQVLKSVIYDFDGFDMGATDLPEGDYSYGDLAYQVSANPLGNNPVLGDRVLRFDLVWNNSYGAFGRGISRYLELDAAQDRLNFYFYNPSANGQPALLDVKIADDDNQNNNYESGSDDVWQTSITVPGSNGWQLVYVPLKDLNDANSGGNGVFDIGFAAGKGMLLSVEFRFAQPQGTTAPATFYIDLITFSEGAMPQGNDILSLPGKKPGDHCLLGAHQKEDPGEYYLIPGHFHALFPSSSAKKIRYVNTYMQWATDGGSTPNMLPGSGYQTLLNEGYTPIITWEPMFGGISAGDAVQPNLTKIVNGVYDNYLDDFGDAMKGYSDTIIVRLMHEFDGDWYPWCVANNQQDPQKFIQAYRYIVNRVRQRGAQKIKWMWCPNSDFVPQESWNWVVNAYPGDAYVDIVATDVYNAHYPAHLPWWRSFRWQNTEIYYYLTKYFPNKPYFLCELACRERTSTEPASSQNKAEWFAAMDKDLQSYFRKTRALVFFNETKSQTWAINSSASALNAVRDHIWMDDYYFLPQPTYVHEENRNPAGIFPNPGNGRFTIFSGSQQPGTITLTNGLGAICYESDFVGSIETDLSDLPAGIYYAQLSSATQPIKSFRLIKK